MHVALPVKWVRGRWYMCYGGELCIIMHMRSIVHFFQVFVATTNIGSGQSLSRSITYTPYSDGTSKKRVYIT